MLDLGLEHLDIQVGNIGFELDLVVKACGESEFSASYCSALLNTFFQYSLSWKRVAVQTTRPQCLWQHTR
jgi:hypothetical protein